MSDDDSDTESRPRANSFDSAEDGPSEPPPLAVAKVAAAAAAAAADAATSANTDGTTAAAGASTIAMDGTSAAAGAGAASATTATADNGTGTGGDEASPSKGGPHVCPLCSRTFRNTQGLGGHMFGCELKQQRKRKREEEMRNRPPPPLRSKNKVQRAGGDEGDGGVEYDEDGKETKEDRRKSNKGSAKRTRFTPTEKAEIILEYENADWKGSLREYLDSRGLSSKFLKFLSQAKEGGWRYTPTREAIMTQAEAAAKGEALTPRKPGKAVRGEKGHQQPQPAVLRGGLDGTRARFKDKGSKAMKSITATVDIDRR
jgi:hypothetical protein